MKVDVRTNCEMTLYFQGPGLGDRFIEWAEAQIKAEEDYWDKQEDLSYWYGPQNFEGGNVLNTNTGRVFTIDGMWEFHVAHPAPGETDRHQLALHVYPNCPMQSLHEKLPEFMKALSIEELECKDQSYVKTIRQALGVIDPEGACLVECTTCGTSFQFHFAKRKE